MPSKDELEELIVEKLLLEFDDFEVLEMVRDHLIELQNEEKTKSVENYLAIECIGKAIHLMEIRPQKKLHRK